MFLDQNCLLFHVITAVSSNIDDMVFKKLFKDRIDVYCIVDTSHANYDRNTTHSHMYSNLLMQPPLLISNKVQCDFQDHRECLWPSISVDRWGGLSLTTTVYVVSTSRLIISATFIFYTSHTLQYCSQTPTRGRCGGPLFISTILPLLPPPLPTSDGVAMFTQ